MPNRTEAEVRQECEDKLPLHRYNTDTGRWELYSALLGWHNAPTTWTPESAVEACVEKWRQMVADLEQDKEDLDWEDDIPAPPVTPSPENWVPSKDFWIGAVNYANEWVSNYDGHLTNAEVRERAERWVAYVYEHKPHTQQSIKEFKDWYVKNIGAWPGGGPTVWTSTGGGLTLCSSYGAGHTKWETASRAALLWYRDLVHEYRKKAVARYAEERWQAGWMPSGSTGTIHAVNYGFELYLIDPKGNNGTHRPPLHTVPGRYSEFTAADQWYDPEGTVTPPSPLPPDPDDPPQDDVPAPDEPTNPPIDGEDPDTGGGSGGGSGGGTGGGGFPGSGGGGSNIIGDSLAITSIVNTPDEVPDRPSAKGDVIWVISTREIYVGQEDGTWAIYSIDEINGEIWDKIPHDHIPNAYWDIPLVERQGDRTTFYWELSDGYHIVSGGWDIYVNIPLEVFENMPEKDLLEYMHTRMGEPWIESIERELIDAISSDRLWPLPEGFVPIGEHEICGSVDASIYGSRAAVTPGDMADVRWVDLQG